MKRLLHSSLVTLLILSSCNNINSFNLEPFDQNGVLKETFINEFQTSDFPDSIGFYIESSGSMNGLFRKNYPTKFKHDISAILMDNEIAQRTISGKVFDKNCKTINFKIKDFKDRMNNGEFVSQLSTDVPIMLQTIVQDLNDKKHDVAVFISDMKYAPIHNAKVKASQYDIEIKGIFSKISNKVVSVIGCESEFLNSDGTTRCSTFPYYITIIGDQSKALWLRNRILILLQEDGEVKGVLDYNYHFDCPNYTIVPSKTTGFELNGKEILKDSIFKGRSYSLLGYNETIKPAQFCIAVDYNHLPKEMIDSISVTDFIISSSLNSLHVTTEVVPEKNGCIDKIKGIADPNTILKFSIENFSSYQEDVLSVRLKDSKNSTSWLEKYYGATSDTVCAKTVSIDDFLKGLKSAFGNQNEWQTKPMYIFVTNKNI